jgi:hypothetical protein
MPPSMTTEAKRKLAGRCSVLPFRYRHINTVKKVVVVVVVVIIIIIIKISLQTLNKMINIYNHTDLFSVY